MHVKDSSISLNSQHQLESQTERHALIAQDAAGNPVAFDKLLEEVRLASDPHALIVSQTPSAEAIADPRETTLQRILDILLGRHTEHSTSTSFDPVSLPKLPELPQAKSLPALELVTTHEMESCRFSASGKACLADGSTREFAVSYEMQRQQDEVYLSANGAKLRDPLVLDLGQPLPTLAKQSVDFDLDADGTQESMRMPDTNSALLFYDRNHNGKADNGSELFGAKSGDGFGELASLDSDGNHWIDEGDAAFADLMLWRMGRDGNTSVESLAKAGIGALSIAYADTPFTVKENGADVAQVRTSSVWLGENNGAGTIRQMDLAVTGKAEGTPPILPTGRLEPSESARDD